MKNLTAKLLGVIALASPLVSPLPTFAGRFEKSKQQMESMAKFARGMADYADQKGEKERADYLRRIAQDYRGSPIKPAKAAWVAPISSGCGKLQISKIV
jgi:hypothetical protein